MFGIIINNDSNIGTIYKNNIWNQCLELFGSIISTYLSEHATSSITRDLSTNA